MLLSHLISRDFPPIFFSLCFVSAPLCQPRVQHFHYTRLLRPRYCTVEIRPLVHVRTYILLFGSVMRLAVDYWNLFFLLISIQRNRTSNFLLLTLFRYRRTYMCIRVHVERYKCAGVCITTNTIVYVFRFGFVSRVTAFFYSFYSLQYLHQHLCRYHHFSSLLMPIVFFNVHRW